MRFIDLFAGLGGFHLALKDLGHKCVFASEIDQHLREIYYKNFKTNPRGDIRKIKINEIPPHDILCAGFPCQPFSKAGNQKGTLCPKWGDLFNYVLRILRKHQPRYILLENVPNLKYHNNGETWKGMQQRLERCGYDVDADFLSPHSFGIPQIRKRLFIVGARKGLNGFKWPSTSSCDLSINSILDDKPKNARILSKQSIRCLETWQGFLDIFPTDLQLPSFPIWSMEFGATYPFEDVTPFALGTRGLTKFKGIYGYPLRDANPKERTQYLPSYAKTSEKQFPDWKIRFIRQNREFYKRHKKNIDSWLPKIQDFPPSLQKFEWNCKGEKRNIWKYIIQFRASGVRIKRPTTTPSLVAMTSTQVPIIGWQKRYMTTRECSRLQSMGNLKFIPVSKTKAYKAFGNAVNADIVRIVAKSLLGGNNKSKKVGGSQRRRLTNNVEK